ncbi:DUF3833 family protein [Sphingomonas sp. MAH-20]|uniref:DUF3833 family protein n=1 Tax=Sphingomonas horti TaxID=2682842 RepID=A0A6I4IYU6_9SPHN|nr:MULTISPECIES: DUF3833 family protein [Sphingomonas]MBA2918455.1 DUF3833 family protein [Sphingomonas sp. CGMCC 1.13658]MVO77422.1 DUF3833 family protein [Sphingomonas horti]
MFQSTGARIGLLAAVALAGCSASHPGEELARPQPVFGVAAFFAGRTHGDATLKIIFKHPEPVRVEGFGRSGPDGTLVLDQEVRRGTRAPEKRQWRFRPLGGNRFAGTLTDATGPVAGEVQGNMLHLRYPMKDGVTAEQWIYLQPGGRTALNRMRLTKLGITVGRLDETIRKLD